MAGMFFLGSIVVVMASMLTVVHWLMGEPVSHTWLYALAMCATLFLPVTALMWLFDVD